MSNIFCYTYINHQGPPTGRPLEVEIENTSRMRKRTTDHTAPRCLGIVGTVFVSTPLQVLYFSELPIADVKQSRECLSNVRLFPAINSGWSVQCI